MKRILITGATGNIGMEIIRFLFKNNTENQIIAGVRDIEKAKQIFNKYPQLEYVTFDFERFDSFEVALENIDTIFLLRPPHISDVPTYFNPLIEKIKQKNIHQIVFLSVQGVETSKIIPHNKIEKLIRESETDYIFMRPSYFMQNLTTTLLKDIQFKRQIILPAGKAKFNWIDIENIGESGAIVLTEFQKYKNQAIELTGYENENIITRTLFQYTESGIDVKGKVLGKLQKTNSILCKEKILAAGIEYLEVLDLNTQTVQEKNA